MQFWPEGQSVLRRHSMHVPALHTGVAEGQSAFARQATQVLSVAQNFPVWVAQSAFAVHSTQTASLVLQTGVAPEHSVDDVQPGMQVNVLGLQIGLVAPHWLLSRHATHLPVVPKQKGAPGAVQSASEAQATHDSVAASQILFVPAQGFVALQATHAPTVVSHTGVALGQPDASLHGT
jgi:hypothetical protein